MKTKNSLENSQELYSRLDLTRIPHHLAIIMDGNRRWAKERSLPVVMGHKAGVNSFRQMVENCADLGVKVLTAYAFSKENWKRIPQEVIPLLKLFRHYAVAERKRLKDNGIRFRVIGDPVGVPTFLQEEFKKTQEFTADCSRMLLNLAVNYSARDEIISAVSCLLKDHPPANLTPELFARYLFTGDCPDPDLLIRTSGEYRVSNFLLWQLAYTEFYFTQVYWPDFDKAELYKALLAYQERKRRYGGDKE